MAAVEGADLTLSQPVGVCFIVTYGLAIDADFVAVSVGVGVVEIVAWFSWVFAIWAETFKR